MCSVVGYVGKNYCKSNVLDGLSRLEYRGYDSAGFACINPQDHRILYAKTPGRLQNLVKQLEHTPIDGFLGIGHTRWSTHGVSTSANAHPQFDCEKMISVVHNGIIENHHQLRKSLQEAGHNFHSQTDTECIAHLFESTIASRSSLKDAVLEVVGQLQGAYAIIAILQQHPEYMVVIRRRSPICIGVGQDEMFVASDVLAFAGKTNNVVFLPDESFALVKKNSIELFNFSGSAIAFKEETVAFDWKDQEKKGMSITCSKKFMNKKMQFVRL